MTKDYKFFHGGVNNETALVDLQTIIHNDDFPSLIKKIGSLERECFAVLNFPCVSFELMVYALEDTIYGEYAIMTYDGQFWTEIDEVPNVLDDFDWEAENINEEVENVMWDKLMLYAAENPINFYTNNK